MSGQCVRQRFVTSARPQIWGKPSRCSFNHVQLAPKSGYCLKYRATRPRNLPWPVSWLPEQGTRILMVNSLSPTRWRASMDCTINRSSSCTRQWTIWFTNRKLISDSHDRINSDFCAKNGYNWKLLTIRQRRIIFKLKFPHGLNEKWKQRSW